MRDPFAARFRYARVLQGGEIVCMVVNPKDGFGGDVRYTQAVVISRPSVAPDVWVDEARQHVACAARDDRDRSLSLNAVVLSAQELVRQLIAAGSP